MEEFSGNKDEGEDHHQSTSGTQFQEESGSSRRGKKRRSSHNTPLFTREVNANEELLDDGFAWWKYGDIPIRGASFPRSYYRCAYKHSQGCSATKQMKRSDADPNKVTISYFGEHTCKNEAMIMSRLNNSSRQPGAKETDPKASKIHHFISSSEGIKQEESLFPSPTTITPDQREYLLLDFDDITESEGEYETSLTHIHSGYSSTTVEHRMSTDCNFQSLLSAFEDVEVKKIGICGSGGIGKTTVMKDFLSCYDYKRLFDLVLWVTIPKRSPLRKIQNALLQQLSLDVQNIKSDDEVAMILHQTLLARKFILFLDDLSEHVDLPKIGIPSSLDNDLKIVLTARSSHLCESMGMDKIIEAEGLSKEESLQLFLLNVGRAMDSEHIKLCGRAIVDECSGLPLMIKVVGRALRMQLSVHDWKVALKKILLTNNLQVLKLGYDTLEENDMKSCFLFSALFTESKAIKISSLVEYLVDDGFIAGSMSHAHKRGHDIIKHLIDVSLLECTDSGMIEMHDLIRDLALTILSDVEGLQMLLSRYSMSILSQNPLLLDMRIPTFKQTAETENVFSSTGDSKSILNAGQGLREPLSEKEWEEAKMVFLMDNEFPSLPAKPGCSQLQVLFLQRNSSLRIIPSSFFENMSSLQILNLSNTRIKALPQSVFKLQDLQVLILRNCERLFFLPSAIWDLKHLLVLDVHGTEICQLPDQIGQLFCLVYLQLCFYGTMDQDECAMLPSQLIPKGVISNFSELKELSIIVYPGDPRWTKIAPDVTIEVSDLRLSSLSFCFTEITLLENFIKASPAWLHGTLNRFNFIVGHDVKCVVSHVSDDLENEYNSQDRCLRFVDGEDIPDAIKKVLNQATAFYLDHHLTAKSLTKFTLAAMNGLKFCIVKDCPKIKAIINNRNSAEICFPYLELLSIHYCWNLSHIWYGPPQSGSLSMLHRLSVYSCPKLESILSRPMIAALVNLEELIVVDCQSVTNIIDDSVFADPNLSDSNSMQRDAKDKMEVDLPEFAELKIKVLKLHYLPNLVNIWNGGDLPCLEYISIYNCPRLRNLNLKSHAQATIKEIKTETNWWDSLEWENPALSSKLQGRVKEIQWDDIWGNM